MAFFGSGPTTRSWLATSSACGVTAPYSPMVYFRGLPRSPVGQYWTRKTFRPAGVIFRPSPLRSVSHQMTSLVEEGRASISRLISLQLGIGRATDLLPNTNPREG